jgi:hypothetical protein
MRANQSDIQDDRIEATPHVKRLKSGANTRNQFGIIVGAPRFSPYRPLDPLLETNRGMVVFERREVWDPIEA